MTREVAMPSDLEKITEDVEAAVAIAGYFDELPPENRVGLLAFRIIQLEAENKRLQEALERDA